MEDHDRTLTLAARGLLAMLHAGLTLSEIEARTPETSEDFDRQVTHALGELETAGLLTDVAVVE